MKEKILEDLDKYIEYLDWSIGRSEDDNWTIFSLQVKEGEKFLALLENIRILLKNNQE